MSKITEGQINLEKMLIDHYMGELPDEFTKPISYIHQRNGVWEVRKTDVGLFVRQIVEAETPGLSNVVDESIEEMYVPLIPVAILGQAVSFFRHIWKTMKSESFVQVIYDPDTNEYNTFCPKQKVSAGGVAWEVAEGEMPKGIRVLELHSHCDMGSFFSGTDDADEKGDGFYGVVGKLNDFMPKINFRLVLGGEEYETDVEDIFDLDGDVYHSEFPKEWTKNVTQAATVHSVTIKNNAWAGKTWDPVKKDWITSPTKPISENWNNHNHYNRWTPTGTEKNKPFNKFSNLSEDLFADDKDTLDEPLELTEGEYEVYTNYLKDYYNEDEFVMA